MSDRLNLYCLCGHKMVVHLSSGQCAFTVLSKSLFSDHEFHCLFPCNQFKEATGDELVAILTTVELIK